MAKSRTVTKSFQIELSSGRNISDDHWRLIDGTHINYWRSAQPLFAARHFEHKGWRIQVDVDWLPIIQRLQHHYGVMEKVEKAIGTSAMDGVLGQFRHDPIKTSCKVVAVTKENQKGEPNLISFVEALLYDVFLIMNIAAPSSCNPSSAIVKSGSSRFPSQISLSADWFEIALLHGLSDKWPKVGFVPLEKVDRWYSAVRTNVAQLPNNRMERVLFGLLHISAANISHTTVIWLFYALESLYDTKVGENFRSLLERIGLLLSPSERDLGNLRKSLRAMYDLRSAFVHGGLEVIHPMHDDALDSAVNEKYDQLLDVCDFGSALLLASIQSIIERDWAEPQFSERLGGMLIGSGAPG